MAVIEMGEVFRWVLNNSRRCGHRSSSENQLLPRRVEALTGFRLARSAYACCAHSLVVTLENALHSFGDGLEAQLGPDSTDYEHFPKIVEALRHVRIASAAAGGGHSLAMAMDGTVFAWGIDLGS